MNIDIKSKLNSRTISAILAAGESFAGNFFTSKKDSRTICLALEECLNNILLYTGEDVEISISLSAEKGKFSVAVKDYALPGDFENELKGEKGLGLELLHNIVDEYRIDNLGLDGRRQLFSKHYEEMTGADNSNDEEEVPSDIALYVRKPAMEYADSLSKLFYRSFGFSYSWDLVYYPNSYMEAYNNKELISMLMVDENNVVRGHVALCPNESIKGCYELGMALSDPKCRNRGISSKLLDSLMKDVEEIKMPMYYADCTIVHPYSQKSALKLGAVPTGFQFQTMPPEMYQSSFSDGKNYDSGVDICKVFDKRERTVYFPLEVRHIVEHIYRDLQLPRTVINEGDCEMDYTVMESVYLSRNNAGIITIHEIGKDVEKALYDSIFELKKNEVRLITVYCPSNRGTNRVYDYCKSEGFFFTGMFPATDEGDIMIMQKLMSSVVNYDYLNLCDECKWLMEEIKKLDPDYQKKS